MDQSAQTRPNRGIPAIQLIHRAHGEQEQRTTARGTHLTCELGARHGSGRPSAGRPERDEADWRRGCETASGGGSEILERNLYPSPSPLPPPLERAERRRGRGGWWKVAWHDEPAGEYFLAGSRPPRRPRDARPKWPETPTGSRTPRWTREQVRRVPFRRPKILNLALARPNRNINGMRETL
jgi:hypothetical protein